MKHYQNSAYRAVYERSFPVLVKNYFEIPSQSLKLKKTKYEVKQE